MYACGSAKKQDFLHSYIEGDRKFKNLYHEIASHERSNRSISLSSTTSAKENGKTDQVASGHNPPTTGLYSTAYPSFVGPLAASLPKSDGIHNQDFKKTSIDAEDPKHLRATDLRDTSSFLGLFQYCEDHKIRSLIFPALLISLLMIYVFTASLQVSKSEDVTFLVAGTLLFIFGACSWKSFLIFACSIAANRLPTMMSFVVEDEKGVSRVPVPVEWNLGGYKFSSTILFPLAIAISYVRLTVPLQIWLIRTVLRI